MSNYAAKYDIKNMTAVGISKFSKKNDLANLKAEVHKLDIDELKTMPADLSKLSDVVKNEVVKKHVYDKLVKKVG